LKEYAKIKHPNIMKYLLWFKDKDGSIIIVSEYKEGKNLEEFVKDFYKENSESQIPEDKVFFIFGKIIGAL
jgi:serine/threonine protein kinase